MARRIKLSALMTLLAIVLSGCPRIAEIDIYNNTGVSISLNSGGSITHISPGEVKVISFASNSLVVSSEIGEWKYSRDLIPYGGEDGEYFDGTVYLQINESGQVFATREQDKRPQSEFGAQPEGFPIEPSS
ncbi:hypothetical protein [Microbulbifer sp. TYP-18]|uniref:hypothetical protein n=1 Tax=Microbulbifer sp. TYP-18 TaxID=3230024 RepID=UPI0034C60870